LDAFAARVANLIVGNDDNAAVLEMAQTGPELQFERDTLVAWCGGEFPAMINGQPLPRDRAVRIVAGDRVDFGVAPSGLRAWLAVAGGIDVPLLMGSRATYRRAGLGGHNHGRPLAAGEKLATFAPGSWASGLTTALAKHGQRASVWTVRPGTLGSPAPAGTVRAMIGPEWDWFNNDAQREFFSAAWEATREADRMGVRLHGPELGLHKPREMISSTVNTGVVQVPPSGQPIVLLPSRQSVGGYPRIASVATVDIGRFTQLRPGEKVRFTRIPLPLAIALQLQRERDFGRVRMGLARQIA
jgi:antagonist of KipI